MRVLVTGGAGFIGAVLCDSLLKEDHEVLCLDDFRTGAPSKVEALQARYPRFRGLDHDVRVPVSVEVDRIYHLACPASPVHYQADPLATVEIAFLGTHQMLALARATGARMVHVSTSEIYGDPREHPQAETYWGNANPVGPRACYDEGKRVAETLCYCHWERGVDVRVARVFNTYGPGMLPDDGRVIPRFIQQALCGDPLTVYGDGTQTRSFCYIDDLIHGLRLLMAVDRAQAARGAERDEASRLRPVNLGNPHEITMLDLARTIVDLTGSASRVEFHPLPEDEPRQRQPDISRARSLLDWTPRLPLEDGLRQTIAFFAARRESTTPPGVAP